LDVSNQYYIIPVMKSFYVCRKRKQGMRIPNTRKANAKVLFLLTEHHTIKAQWGNGSIAPHILDLGTRWR
jgi:hypothetical protein